MFTILDDIQQIPMATDATLVDNWQHHLADFEQFKRTKGDPLRFAIRHFAEEVRLCSAKWVNCTLLFHLLVRSYLALHFYLQLSKMFLNSL